MSDFEKKISHFINMTEKKMMAAVKDSIQEVVIDAQTPRAKGGFMPVDTGFLRNSGVYAINQLPKGETIGRERREGEEGVLPEYSNPQTGEELNVVLASLKPEDIFYFGWSAIYAQKQELYNGFVSRAVSKWKEHLKNSIARFR